MKWTDLKNSDPLSDILELERKMKKDVLLFGDGIVHIDHGLNESGFTVIVDDRIFGCDFSKHGTDKTIMEFLTGGDKEDRLELWKECLNESYEKHKKYSIGKQILINGMMSKDIF